MFCQNCGKQNPDGSAFCDGCGAQLSAAPAAKSGNGFGAKLVETLLGSLKAPKATAEAVAAEKEGMAIAGVFAGINFLMVFLFLWRFIGAYFTKIADMLDMGVDDFIQKSKIEYGIFPMLVAALVIAALCIAATALVIFLIKKINKQEANFVQLLVAASVNSLIPSAVLLVCTLLSFLLWWFFPIALAAIVVLWIVNICGACGESDNQLAGVGVITGALVVLALLVGLLANWGIGEASNNGKTMNEAYEDSDVGVCHSILDSLMVTED